MRKTITYSNSGTNARAPGMKGRELAEGLHGSAPGQAKEQVIGKIKSQLAGDGSYNLKRYAESLAQFSLDRKERGELGALLAKYTIDHLVRAQFKDLEGLEKLTYLLEGISFAPDKGALAKMRALNSRLETIPDIRNAGDSEALEMLRKQVPEADGSDVAVLRQFVGIMSVSRTGSGNLSDLSGPNPALAALCIKIYEGLAGRKLEYLRTTVSWATRRILDEKKGEGNPLLPRIEGLIE